MTTLFLIVNPSCHPVDTASVSLFWSVSHLPMDWVPTAAVPGNRRDLNWNRHGAGGELEEDQAILINQLYQARLLISKERFGVWNLENPWLHSSIDTTYTSNTFDFGQPYECHDELMIYRAPKLHDFQWLVNQKSLATFRPRNPGICKSEISKHSSRGQGSLEFPD